MKKILAIGLMILTVCSVALAHHDMSSDSNNVITTEYTPRHMNRIQKMKSIQRDPENEKIRIIIDEKKLEVRKELLKENPDWDKIEKLNVEIATQGAILKTCRMRENYEDQCHKQE